MFDSPLPLIIVLLAASVFVVTLARRLGLPSILGYVTVGLVLGPHALGLFPESDTAHLLGALQVFGTAGVVALIAHMFGLQWAQSIVIGGVVAMSSTVLIVQQLTER